MSELITLEGHQALKLEYEELLYKERPELTKVIAWAASNGDRSENADYQYGKKRLREIDRRLRFLAKRLELVKPIDICALNHNTIQFGATVWLEDQEGREKRVTLVGKDEVEPIKGRISLQSPLGRALLNGEEGEIIEFQAPKGLVSFTVIKFSYLSLKELEDRA